jgi:ribose transport system ATP-binding protein
VSKLSKYALEMIGITKKFPGVLALNNVNFKVKKGEVHALVGENGAGKSTLMKVLDGVFIPEEGTIVINGKEVSIKNTNDAKDLGIGLIFQELNLVPSLSAAENVYLGKLKANKAGIVNWRKTNKEAKGLLKKLNFNINPKTLVEELSVAEKQLVEIAKALSIDAKIIIMDEPTASLSESEISKLFDLIKQLKENGVTIVYISHRLEEIFSIADTVTVLRDGNIISTEEVGNETKGSIIEKMVGRSLDMEFPERKSEIGDTVLEVKNLKNYRLNGVSFDLRAGEILGISGLVGSGRTELAKAIFGADPVDSGEIYIKGRKVKIKSPVTAKKSLIALVPEDRKDEGLVLDFSVLMNTTICNLKKILGFSNTLSRSKEKKQGSEIIEKLGVKTPTVQHKTLNLSGGNQQKTVVAKWLFADPDILILDEPTRGIDVGAKYEIYLLMNKMVSEGKAIIMISSELPEVMAMSDRLMVMSEGEIKAIFEKSEINANNIMKAACSG